MGVDRLLFPKRRRHLFKVRISFSCRNEQYTTYSDSKQVKMTNKQLKSAIVIMNMQKITLDQSAYIHATNL